MKKVRASVRILTICMIGIIFIINSNDSGELVTAESITKQVDDFIVHTRIENADKGVRVLQSIQYVGEKRVVIKHQTPLISVSLKSKNHDFTGSPISKELRKGDIYYQPTVNLSSPNKGQVNLFVNARFYVEGERISIEHVEELSFH